ncbi:GMC oxidoreductase [Streptomyces sp. NBC_00078]|uniref:GMC oxidoreductase n=1 Tax=unclassified Streptomyces TaxID=2593676 RepID=UPI00225ACF90|nr:GMC oxidoreductase [Streptomyces sp. NBC_00078]MCX5418509.1 GMC family oxidoreductase [Streptomyces sp. NBC_00078]
MNNRPRPRDPDRGDREPARHEQLRPARPRTLPAPGTGGSRPARDPRRHDRRPARGPGPGPRPHARPLQPGPRGRRSADDGRTGHGPNPLRRRGPRGPHRRPKGTARPYPRRTRRAAGRDTPRDLHLSAFHPAGTAAAGGDPGRAPSDARSRLRGVEGVLVTDASVLPGCPEVNPQLGIMAAALAVTASYLEGGSSRRTSTAA